MLSMNIHTWIIIEYLLRISAVRRVDPNVLVSLSVSAFHRSSGLQRHHTACLPEFLNPFPLPVFLRDQRGLLVPVDKTRPPCEGHLVSVSTKTKTPKPLQSQPLALFIATMITQTDCNFPLMSLCCIVNKTNSASEKFSFLCV